MPEMDWATASWVVRRVWGVVERWNGREGKGRERGRGFEKGGEKYGRWGEMSMSQELTVIWDKSVVVEYTRNVERNARRCELEQKR